MRSHLNPDEFERIMKETTKDIQTTPPAVVYTPENDTLEVVLCPGAFYVEQLKNSVSVYRSHRTNKIVGFCVDKLVPLIEKANT